MERTISFMNGEGSLGHNTRAFIAANVDADRTKDNITLKKVNTKNYVGWGLFEDNELKFKAPEVKYCIEYIKENYNGN